MKTIQLPQTCLKYPEVILGSPSALVLWGCPGQVFGSVHPTRWNRPILKRKNNRNGFYRKALCTYFSSGMFLNPVRRRKSFWKSICPNLAKKLSILVLNFFTQPFDFLFPRRFLLDQLHLLLYHLLFST